VHSAAPRASPTQSQVVIGMPWAQGLPDRHRAIPLCSTRRPHSQPGLRLALCVANAWTCGVLAHFSNPSTSWSCSWAARAAAAGHWPSGLAPVDRQIRLLPRDTRRALSRRLHRVAQFTAQAVASRRRERRVDVSDASWPGALLESLGECGLRFACLVRGIKYFHGTSWSGRPGLERNAVVHSPTSVFLGRGLCSLARNTQMPRSGNAHHALLSSDSLCCSLQSIALRSSQTAIATCPLHSSPSLRKHCWPSPFPAIALSLHSLITATGSCSPNKHYTLSTPGIPPLAILLSLPVLWGTV
jgi:hypothetical protein